MVRECWGDISSTGGKRLPGGEFCLSVGRFPGHRMLVSREDRTHFVFHRPDEVILVNGREMIGICHRLAPFFCHFTAVGFARGSGFGRQVRRLRTWIWLFFVIVMVLNKFTRLKMFTLFGIVTQTEPASRVCQVRRFCDDHGCGSRCHPLHSTEEIGDQF